MARLQQLALAGLLCLALAVAVPLLRRGHWGWGLAVAGLVLAGHALVLALEFACVARINRGAQLPPQRGRTLLRAWAREVWLDALVFGWRQPFCARSEPDYLPAAAPGRRAVVLVHGFVCNRAFWLDWTRRLRREGVPFVAVNLEPVFGSIDDYPPIIEAAVRRVTQATGLAPLLVAHSMGGLAVRAWLRDFAADARVAGVVTLGTPHHGTWTARWGVAANSRQMRLDSRWLQALARQESADRRALFTCYWSPCDNIVFPAMTATLAGADNRCLPGLAHLDLAWSKTVQDEVRQRLAAPVEVELPSAAPGQV